MIANFPNYFKTVRIIQMTANFSRWFQNCPDFSRWLPIFRMISNRLDFSDDCQFSGLFQNCLDFSRWLPIFQMISKLSEFFQMTTNFPDDFKLSGFFQMTANILDDFKSVRIFPDAEGNPNAANVVWHTNFCLEGRGYPKLRKKQVFLVKKKKPIFIYFCPFWSILWPFGPFLTLSNTKTPF